jgi:hypothetical protein
MYTCSLVRIYRLPGSFAPTPPSVRRTRLRIGPGKAAAAGLARCQAPESWAPPPPVRVLLFDPAMGTPEEVPPGAVLVPHLGPLGRA